MVHAVDKVSSLSFGISEIFVGRVYRFTASDGFCQARPLWIDVCVVKQGRPHIRRARINKEGLGDLVIAKQVAVPLKQIKAAKAFKVPRARFHHISLQLQVDEQTVHSRQLD